VIYVRTRQCENLYFPASVLTLYQKGVYSMGIKIVNKLPSHLKELVESPKIFKRTLKNTYFFIVFTNLSFIVLTLNLFLMCLNQFNLLLFVCMHMCVCVCVCVCVYVCMYKLCPLTCSFVNGTSL
jgi:hypothetical protein